MAARGAKQLEHPALAQLRGYWEGLRSQGALPTRAQIDPRGIERALEYAFIAERIAPGIARVRLAGMHLNDLLGMEVRGMPLTALLEPVAREEFSRQLERAFAEPAVVDMTLDSGRTIGRPALTARLLLLPLQNETGEVIRVLGGLVAEGGIGRAPRRFRLSYSSATVCEHTPIRTQPAKVSAGFAEEKKTFAARTASVGAPHLQLVYSSDD